MGNNGTRFQGLGNMSVRTKIMSVGIVGLLASLILAGVTLWSFSSMSAASEEMKTQLKKQLAAETLAADFMDLDRSQNLYLVDAAQSGAAAVDPASDSYAPYVAANARMQKALDEFPPLKQESTQALLAGVKENFADYDKHNTEIVNLIKADNPASTKQAYTVAGGPATDLANDTVSKSQDLVKEINNMVVAAEADQASAASTAKIVMFVTLLLVGALLIFISLLISRGILAGVNAVRSSLEAMGKGDLTVPADVSSNDEIGSMAMAAEATRNSMRKALGDVTDASAVVAAAAEELSAVSLQVGSSAQSSAHQADSASAAADVAASNANSLAAGTEQMSASIREISHSTADALNIASQAVAVADNTNLTISKLGESSAEIGNVVKTITSIAEQTNLLALNATIEAARAGEAGKGFAVVASEVKELAQETARATEDISQRVVQIQADTEAAVGAITQISMVIGQINDSQSTIASAVEEQSATTNEMSRSASQTADSLNTIVRNATGLAQASVDTTSAAGSAQEAATSLAAQASELQRLVGAFRI